MQLLHASLMREEDEETAQGEGDRHAVEAFDFMGSMSGEETSSTDED